MSMINFRVYRYTRRRAHLIIGFILLLTFLALIHRFSNIGELICFLFLPYSKGLSLSIHCNGGRLGNQMCTYATLYGLSKLNKRSFISLSCNLENLKPHFPALNDKKSVPSALYFQWNSWDISPWYRSVDAAIPSKSNFIQGYFYPCSYTFFDHVREQIRQEFHFSEELQQHANSVLNKANMWNLDNITFVGIHVRGGDYEEDWLNVFGGVPANKKYFEETMEYFHNKYDRTIFILISEDRTWASKQLSERFGFYVPENAPSPIHDLAILANCNHTIMTYGTFGFWGAYLAGGEVLYFDKFLKPNTTFTTEEFLFDKMYPPRWKGLVTIDTSVFENMTLQN